MNRQITATCALVLLAVMSSGCKSLLKKRLPAGAASESAPVTVAPPPSLTAPAAPVPAASAAPAPAAAVDEDAALPAPTDFEDEAFGQITSQNFRAEFAKLKQEIEAKPTAGAVKN